MKITAIVVFFLFLPAWALTITDVPHLVYSAKYVVDKTGKGYTEEVLIRGTKLKEKRQFYIYHNSLETIEKVKCGFIKKSGRLKRSRNVTFSDNKVQGQLFYSDFQVKNISIPEGKDFFIKYKTTSSFLLGLSMINFFYFYPVDSFYYSIQVPKGLNLKYDTLNFYSLRKYKIDTVFTVEDVTYNFSAIPEKDTVEHKFNLVDLLLEKPFVEKKFPAVRLIVTPEKYTAKESEYFSDWIIEKHNDRSTFKSKKLISLIDSLSKFSDRDSMVLAAFNYVRDKINYLDIMIGLGAFVADYPDKVFEKKQGDCKGMANLLKVILVRLGFDARLGITSTPGHICQTDFPCLAAANHMICMLKNDTGWVCLDPTDRITKFPKPPMYMQGRYVFITGDGAGRFYRLPVMPSNYSHNEYTFKVDLSDSLLTGKFDLKLRGYSVQKYFYEYSISTKRDFNKFISEFLNSGPFCSNFEYIINQDSIHIIGSFEISKSEYLSQRTKKYFFPGFAFKYVIKNLENRITMQKVGYKSIDVIRLYIIHKGSKVVSVLPENSANNGIGVQSKVIENGNESIYEIIIEAENDLHNRNLSHPDDVIKNVTNMAKQALIFE